jgi:hypothetical protein
MFRAWKCEVLVNVWHICRDGIKIYFWQNQNPIALWVGKQYNIGRVKKGGV